MVEEIIVEARNLKKWFSVRKGFLSSLFGRRVSGNYIKAVDGVSFKIRKGEILGLAGESGCGKTTTGYLMVGLLKPTSGQIIYQGKNIYSMNKAEFKFFRRSVQMVFQDPYGSLNPRFTCFKTILEPLEIHKIKGERSEKVFKVMEAVGLRPPEKYLDKYPHQLSGGERQRVSIARALVLEPSFIVADEPVSMLDVSIRAGILHLLKELTKSRGISCLYISHDLSLIRYMCDTTAIMYLGKIVEMAPTEDLIAEPLHPYSQALLAAVPVPNPDKKRKQVRIRGAVPDAISPPHGCRFWPRCVYSQDICKQQEPELIRVNKERMVACHLFGRKD